ncbi:MAG TPA: protein-methionine-sulfoxide reductase catalytic subunit MsrP [Tepidisphaeraceae bacterium]|jgi:sulfoxide reductase catalytic subunit YedY|nr:protein-methionine-sulfoxide reductase catalytic subunit MsrP [Tepidisphaeraceae bacterium]
MTPVRPQFDKITPPEVYHNRRVFLKTGIVAATAVATGFIYRQLNGLPPPTVEEPALEGFATTAPTTGPASAAVDPAIARAFHVNEAKTPYQSITHYNNFYEFSTDKDGVAGAVGNFSTAGWKITVDGLVDKPTVFDLDDIRKISPPEERVYRMRCVEAWSMVIPWAGYSLSKLLDRVKPKSSAKYVAFTSLLDPTRMPGQNSDILKWPYIEGLRMDEAMHPLTLLTTGLYGKQLPVQDGAPVRIIIPWKYGFKGIKSIVKISLVENMPETSWNRYGPSEYGFYANVNPQHDHPRWSQATEQRIGESERRPTLMFNGYAEQVASLYAGMDLDKFY